MSCRITLICAAAPPRPVFPADEPAAPALLARVARLAAGRAGCVTSPLLRARQTTAALGLDARPEPALREADFGAWAGQAIAAVPAADPAGFAAWHHDPQVAPPGGESFAAMAARVAAWLEAQAAGAGRDDAGNRGGDSGRNADCDENAGDENAGAGRSGRGELLAITHPGPIQAALLHVLAAPLASARRIGVRPLSQTRLSHDGSRWSLLIGGQGAALAPGQRGPAPGPANTDPA